MSKENIDPFLASVIHGALEDIALEMGQKLMRMSYSSIIRESEDFGTALTDQTGRQKVDVRWLYVWTIAKYTKFFSNCV